ncbi:hypothetical protein HN385_03975 [archaeon]|jgi:hypothetical protein|nr:hypothetical protein [archaeon]MBT3450907.1 hypothetical protein [archaeon]MBT6869089.1 hypothetical protein [archaeon]MBT7193332.1 hypothetical protein [archaeon]MBT7380340.1 hypothetical protein [archaeon]
MAKQEFKKKGFEFSNGLEDYIAFVASTKKVGSTVKKREGVGLQIISRESNFNEISPIFLPLKYLDSEGREIELPSPRELIISRNSIYSFSRRGFFRFDFNDEQKSFIEAQNYFIDGSDSLKGMRSILGEDNVSFSTSDYLTYEKEQNNHNSIKHHFILGAYLPRRIVSSEDDQVKLPCGYLFNCPSGDLEKLVLLKDHNGPIEISGPVIARNVVDFKNPNIKKLNLYVPNQNILRILDFDPLTNEINEVKRISNGKQNRKILNLDVLGDLILYTDNNLGIYIGKEGEGNEVRKYYHGPGEKNNEGKMISPFFNNDELLVPSSDIGSVKLVKHYDDYYAILGLSKGILKCYKINQNENSINLEFHKKIQLISMKDYLGVTLNDLDDFPFNKSSYRESSIKNFKTTKNVLHFTYRNFYININFTDLFQKAYTTNSIASQGDLYDFFNNAKKGINRRGRAITEEAKFLLNERMVDKGQILSLDLNKIPDNYVDYFNDYQASLLKENNSKHVQFIFPANHRIGSYDVSFRCVK